MTASKEEFEYRLFNGARFIAPDLLIYAFIPVAVHVLYAEWGTEAFSFVVLFTICFWSLLLIPAVVLQIQYLLANKGARLVVDLGSMSLDYEHSSTVIRVLFSEIVRLRFVKSRPYAENRMRFMPWERYNHTIIVLQDGRTIVVTCFLVDNFDLPIDPQKKEVVKAVVPFIRGHRR